MLGNTIHGIAHVRVVARRASAPGTTFYDAPRFSAEDTPSSPTRLGTWQRAFRNVAQWLGYGNWLKKQDLLKKLTAQAKTNGISDLIKQSGELFYPSHPLMDAMASRHDWGDETVQAMMNKASEAISGSSTSLTTNRTSLNALCRHSLPKMVISLQKPEHLDRALKILQDTGSLYAKADIADKLAQATTCMIPGYMDTVLTLLEQAPIHHTMMPIGPLATYNAKAVQEQRWPRFAELVDVLAKTTPDSLKPAANVQRLLLFLKQPATETEWHATMDQLQVSARTGEDMLKLLDKSMLDWASQQKDATNQDWLSDFLLELSKGHTVSSEMWHHSEMRSVLNYTKSLKSAILYQQMTHHNPDAWINFLPQLILNLPPQSTKDFMRNLEFAMERFHPGKGHHPNEAEMMMMLRHPQDPKRQEIGQTVSTITSVYRYLTHSIFNVPDRLTKVWSDAGFLTHSFRFWRYDSQGGESSLLAKYGFKKLLPRQNDAVYGPGYILTKSITPHAPLQEGTLVEFRRAYLLVSNPQHGTLLIRNSSKEFGRDTMAHPAYYSRKALTSVDLKTFDIKQHLAPWPPLTSGYQYMTDEMDPPPPPHADKFMSIADPRLFPTRVMPTHGGKHAERQVINRSITPLDMLMKELLKVKDDYRRWKFDTGAFKDKAFSGHESPGFRATIDFVGRWSDMYDMGLEDKPPPELGFVHPDYPPWETYKYTDQKGQEQRTFKPTPEHVDEMSQYVQGKLAGEALLKSDWYQFLRTGIRNRAELIMLAPETTAMNKEKTNVDSKPV